MKKAFKELDKLERDNFIADLQKRDQAKTEQKSMGTIVENQDNSAVTFDELRAMVPALRKKSRQAYLKIRDEQVLDLYKRNIDEERRVFGDEEMTAEEKRTRELKETLFNLANKFRQKKETEPMFRLPDQEDDEEAQMTREQRLFKKMNQKYREDRPKAGQPEITEEERFQMDKEKQANSIFGGTNKKAKKQDKEYELLLDNQVDFVQSDLLGGLMEKHVKNEAKKQLKKEKKKKKKQNDSESDESSDSSLSEEQIEQMEKQLTPLERERLDIKQQRESLPMYTYRDNLLAAIRDHQVLIIVAETGSGKTTQVPQYLHEIGYTKFGKIGVTQPRRVAAMSVSARVAQEMGCKLGHEVGYSIRFEDCSSDKTILKYMTDGMLLREFLSEPDLKSYTCLMIDEAHERTLHTDILFGLVKDVARARPDLKLIISSATLEAAKFSEFFDDAPIFKVPGRRFPVDIYYTKQPEADYVEAAVVTALQIHVTQPKGDILVFLTGQEEIETAQEMLQ